MNTICGHPLSYQNNEMMHTPFALSAFDLLLFDLDGTLVDSAPDIAQAVDATLQTHGWPVAGLERVRHWVGNGSRTLIERALCFVFAEFDITQPEQAALHESVHTAFLQHYAVHNGPSTVIFVGALPFLHACQAAGKQMACVTNKPERLARDLLQCLQLDLFFSLVIGGDTFPVRKPDPTALLYCCTELNVSPVRTLMVGDSSIDVNSARNAGIPVACVRYGYNHGADIADAGADWLVDDLRQLLG